MGWSERPTSLAELLLRLRPIGLALRALSQRKRVISPRLSAFIRTPLKLESPLHEIARIVAGGDDRDADFLFNIFDRQIV